MAITTPISYWKLDESSGNASDSIGSNTLTNTSTTYAAGLINNGAIFNASSSKLVMGSTAFSASYSYSFWLYRNSGGSYYGLISKDDGSTRLLSILSNNSGNIEGTVWLSTGSQSITPFAITNSVWNHITITVESGVAIKVYLNGNLIQTIAISFGALTTSFGTWFGADQFSGGRWFLDGKMDEIALWNVAITAEEVSKIYNAGRGNQYPFTEDLTTSSLAYYKFDSSNSNDSIASYNGTDTSVTYGTGKIGNGAIFDATSDKIVFSSLTNFPTTGDFSINFWVNTSSMSTNYDSVGGVNDGSNSWHVNMNSGTTMWFNHYDGGTDKNVDFTNTFSTSTWYMLTVTRSGDTVTTYVNASNSNATTGWSARNFGTASGGLKLGQARTGTALPATYDEIGLWSRALTGTEITQLYNAGAGFQYPFSTAITSNNLSLLGVS